MLELKVRKIGNSLGVFCPRKLSTPTTDEGDRLFLIEAQTELTSSRPTTRLREENETGRRYYRPLPQHPAHSLEVDETV